MTSHQRNACATAAYTSTNLPKGPDTRYAAIRDRAYVTQRVGTHTLAWIDPRRPAARAARACAHVQRASISCALRRRASAALRHRGHGSCLATCQHARCRPAEPSAKPFLRHEQGVAGSCPLPPKRRLPPSPLSSEITRRWAPGPPDPATLPRAPLPAALSRRVARIALGAAWTVGLQTSQEGYRIRGCPTRAS